MKNSSLLQQSQTPSQISQSSTTANGLRHRHPQPTPPSSHPSIPITRYDPNNPYPTTFVQADTSSFKQVVQMLTGSTDPAARTEPARSPIPPIKTGPKNKSSSKLYERRNSLKNYKINTRPAGYAGSPRPGAPEILSPSILDFPSLALSPVTPLILDPFNRGAAGRDSSYSCLDMAAEEKAIKEKGFYFHPSPADTPKDSEPRLLPLFPVTSPRVAGSSPIHE